MNVSSNQQCISPEYLDKLQQTANSINSTVEAGLKNQSKAQLQDVSTRLNSIIATLRNAHISVQTFVNADTVMITEENIQETFYNAIPEAVGACKSLIKVEDIKDQESYIYLALGALATISILEFSLDLAIGIRLIGNKIITKRNCPATHLDFLTALMQIKEGMKKLTKVEIESLKIYCYNDPKDKNLPKVAPHIVQLASAINRIASMVSQRDGFRKLIPAAMEASIAFCD